MSGRSRASRQGRSRLSCPTVESSGSAGAFLFDETATVDSFYVVLEGEVEISRLDGADEISLDTHRTGEFTGGLAVLTGKTSIHRARAAGSESHPGDRL